MCTLGATYYPSEPHMGIWSRYKWLRTLPHGGLWFDAYTGHVNSSCNSSNLGTGDDQFESWPGGYPVQEDAQIIPAIRPRSPSFTSFLIHYSLNYHLSHHSMLHSPGYHKNKFKKNDEDETSNCMKSSQYPERFNNHRAQRDPAMFS
jgi:hypothetical protein